MRSQNLIITAVTPAFGVPGGEVTIQCRGFRPGHSRISSVLIGQMEAGIISASEDRVVVRLPDSPNALGVSLRVGKCQSAVFPFSLATRLATGVHPVASPLISRDGNIITTISGSRGQRIPQPIVQITPAGETRPLACEIVNPTGLAFGNDGQLYISSRNDGSVVRYTDYEHMELVAEDLGVACGIVFDSKDNLYIGDRSGRIIRIGPSGERKEFATLTPSVSAFHLAMDERDRLYVTGPTLAMRDPLYRITQRGEVEVVMHGLARPQGMAFLENGDLLLAAAHRGKKGIFRYSAETGELTHYIAGPILVGLAVSRGKIILASSDSIFVLQYGLGTAGVF